MGLIITLTGCSGSGKSSIVESLLRDPNYRLVLSNTTRARRPVDMPGEYTYLTDQQYNAISYAGDWLWTAGIATGSRYGTRKKDLDDAITNDKYNLMVLMPDSIPKLRKYALAHGGKLMHVWIDAPEDQRRVRLAKRGEIPANIETRVRGEILWRHDFETQGMSYTPVPNPDGALETTIAQVRSLIQKYAA